MFSYKVLVDFLKSMELSLYRSRKSYPVAVIPKEVILPGITKIKLKKWEKSILSNLVFRCNRNTARASLAYSLTFISKDNRRMKLYVVKHQRYRWPSFKFLKFQLKARFNVWGKIVAFLQ